MPNAHPTRESIRRYIRKKGSATGPDIADSLGITRQAVSNHVRKLLADGEIFKTGSTRAARYYPREAAGKAQRIERDYPLRGLDEALVYEDVATFLTLSRLPDNVESLIRYAFTEMLNNAIDHSMADKCHIDVQLDATKLAFTIRDTGVGAFRSIVDKFSLPDEHSAMIELIKGKTTTKPDAHSGEGIFFVSKAGDRFVLRSHRLQIDWDHVRGDVFVSEPRFLKGTLVHFEIRRDSRTRLTRIFDEFAPEEYDYQFQKTRVLVKLLRRDYVSRSEAKRLLHNLDRFSEIELDMRDVVSVGQGFADEVFRVFTSAHPEIVVSAVNSSKAIDAMIRHVRHG